MLRLALVLAIVASGCGIVGLSPKSTPAAVTMAPAIELPTHRGETFSLAGERAKRDVVLVFYRGHW